MSERTVDDLEAILDERFKGRWWALNRNNMTSSRRWFSSAPGVLGLPGFTLREALDALEVATRPKIEPRPVTGLAVTWDGSDQALEAIRSVLPEGRTGERRHPSFGTLSLLEPSGERVTYAEIGERVIVIDGRVVVL